MEVGEEKPGEWGAPGGKCHKHPRNSEDGSRQRGKAQTRSVLTFIVLPPALALGQRPLSLLPGGHGGSPRLWVPAGGTWARGAGRGAFWAWGFSSSPTWIPNQGREGRTSYQQPPTPTPAGMNLCSPPPLHLLSSASMLIRGCLASELFLSVCLPP